MGLLAIVSYIAVFYLLSGSLDKPRRPKGYGKPVVREDTVKYSVVESPITKEIVKEKRVMNGGSKDLW